MTRWTTILARVDAFVAANPEHVGSKEIVSRSSERKKGVRRYLNDLDIRDAAALRGVIGDAFPVSLRGRHGLVADIDDGGHWVLERKPQQSDMVRH